MCCDVRNMKNDIEDESIDVVIDKGTLDSVLVNKFQFSQARTLARTVRKCLVKY